MADGQRECARNEWCAGYRMVQQDDGTSKRRPGLTYTPFCTTDTALIAEKLGELPEAYSRLEADLGDPVRRSEMIRIPFGPAIPLSEYYDSLIRQIAPGLSAWAARVRAVKQLSAPHLPILSAAGVAYAAFVLQRNLSALLALQPGWMTRTFSRPPGKSGKPPSITDLEATYGDCEIVRFGIDSVTLMVQMDGTDAGLEILGLHRKCVVALGEAATRPELLDGIPCRACGVMGLERAKPPSDPTMPENYSHCPGCSDQMALETYRAWVKRYEAWARSLGSLTCQRCVNGDCDQCVYHGCECAAAGHQHAA